MLLLAGAAAWVWFGHQLKRRGPAMLDSVRLNEPGRLGPTPPGPFVPGAALVLAGLAVWLVQPIGAVMARTLADSAAPLSPGQAEPALRPGVIAQTGGHAAAGLMIALVVLMLPGTWRALGAAVTPPWKTVRLAFVWTLLVGPAVYVVGSLSLWAARTVADLSGRPAPDDVAHETLTRLTAPDPGSTPWWWATVLGVTVGAPIIEEFIYRGFIQTGLLRLTRSSPTAIVGASLPFALAHAGAVETHALLTLFVLSLGFGLALEKTGKLWVCILMHAAFNGANVALAMVR